MIRDEVITARDELNTIRDEVIMIRDEVITTRDEGITIRNELNTIRDEPCGLKARSHKGQGFALDLAVSTTAACRAARERSTIPHATELSESPRFRTPTAL